MKIEYKIELLNGFYNNHSILSENKLYESNHKNSAFKSLLKIEKEYFKDQDYTTVIAYENGKPIGFVLFEHYKKIDSGKFTFRKEKRYFLTFGNMMVYVKPEYRKKGIAFKMTEILEESLTKYVSENYDLINHYVMINAVDAAYSLLEKSFKTFVPSYTSRNNTKNKSDLISALTYHVKYKPLTN